MPIVPDDKNWTWVLERPCRDCGFVAENFEPADTPSSIRANAVRWQELLAHPNVRLRPNDSTWSALEYGCHVRDVFRLFNHRLERMLDEDAPQFANWDQDVTAIEERYSEQNPAVVAAELAEAAEVLATTFERVTLGDHERTGFRSDGAAFTIGSFARYLMHDPLHHVWDVEQGYDN
ncbi:MAG: DinB family protein [Actinomycetia bacterium]|nr:DinB family protein [Actinomycetes bacterium]